MLNKDNLGYFTGSENFYKHRMSGLIYTDGIHYIAEHGGTNGAYWLIDLIGSYQRQLKGEEFQLWTLKVNDKKAVITCQSDSDMPNLVEQHIEYTDFDLKELKLYVENNCCCLPSER